MKRTTTLIGTILLILLLETFGLVYVAKIIEHYIFSPLGLTQYILYQWSYKLLAFVSALIVANYLRIKLHFKLPKRDHTSQVMWIAPLLITASITIIKIIISRHDMIAVLKNAVMAVTVGMAEDTFAWGIVLSLLLSFFSKKTTRYRNVYALLIASGLFASMHLMNLFHQDLLGTMIQIIYTFGLGSLLGMTYICSGSLIIPILIHAMWDFPLIFNDLGQHSTITLQQAIPFGIMILFISGCLVVYSTFWLAPNNVAYELEQDRKPLQLLNRMGLTY